MMTLHDHLHAELLRAQWRLIELLEALPPDDARELLQPDLELQFAEAEENLPELKQWPQLPAKKVGIYGSPTNRTRMYRVCRLLDSTDRLLDIGTNVGYFAGMLATRVKPAGYTGIDLAQKYLDGVAAMAEANGLDIAHWNLEVGDLYKLTPEWVAKQDPTVVLLLEVLEHLPDPRAALETLARVMPEDAQLLFSVPMLGRLEACWGHHSLFDAERVRQLCTDAGLHIHWVEPVVNTWKLVLAGPSPRRPERLARIVETRLPEREPVTIADPAFQVVPAQKAEPCGLGKVSAADRGVRVDAEAPKPLLRKAQPATAGLTLPVDGVRALRLELEGIDTSGVTAVVVEGKDAEGEPTCRWELTVSERRAMPRKAVTYVFRPGRNAAGYRPTFTGDADATRTVDVSVRLAPGTKGSFGLRRAAYVR